MEGEKRGKPSDGACPSSHLTWKTILGLLTFAHQGIREDLRQYMCFLWEVPLQIPFHIFGHSPNRFCMTDSLLATT